MLNKLLKEITKLDIFAYQPSLSFQKRRKYYTLPGGIFTILIGFFVLELSIHKFGKMINYEDPYITVIDTVANFKEIGS